jgi:FlaG protein.
MPINLNKIDPVIINNVQQQTVEEVIHPSEKTKISKDKEREKGGQSYKGTKGKINKFNSVLSTMKINIMFVMEGNSVMAVDEKGDVIRRYSSDDIDELLNRMEDMIGILIDAKK